MLDEDYMEGLCAGCYEMQPIRFGLTKCDWCASNGGSHRFDPEPYPKKSGPNSLPEE